MGYKDLRRIQDCEEYLLIRGKLESKDNRERFLTKGKVEGGRH